MKSHINLKLFLILLIPSNLMTQASNLPAVIKDRVMEMNNSFPAPTNPAASPDAKSCRRAHQGLFNELVDCIEEQDDQVKIAYPNIVYGFDVETQKALSTFWAYKKHLIALHNLDDNLLQTIPNQKYGEEHTVVLIYPWQKFSVGTRFKHLPDKDTTRSYAIIYADYITNKAVLDLVPHEDAIPEIKQTTPIARKLFVQIINNLIDRIAESSPNHVIPYVWGGSSFVEPYADNDFYKKDGTWHRNGPDKPYTGYDCSEFVMRMAQIAGLDFPWKTTTAIQRSRRSLSEDDQLETGDLIWTPGHVMIVSSLERNELIEARSYGSGYGCVHRIKLEECFDGITTYEELRERYNTNQPIKYKDKEGLVSEKSTNFKLLKLVD